MSKQDFAEIFSSLDLGLTDGQLDRLFTMIDLDASGDISEEEFVGAWNDLRSEFVRNSLRKSGISSAQLAAIVSAMVAVLILTLAFVLIMYGAWTAQTNTEAVLQSIFIGGIGKGATYLGDRAAGVNGEEEANKLIENALEEQEADGQDT